MWITRLNELCALRTPGGSSIGVSSGYFDSDSFPKNSFPLSLTVVSESSPLNLQICLSASLSRQSDCPSSMAGQMQKTLVAIATMIATTGSVDMCLEECVQSERFYGLPCRSVAFYPQRYATNFDCVLNTETARSRPDLLTDVPKDIPVFYAENGCRSRL